jgi:hypothetical protein
MVLAKSTIKCKAAYIALLCIVLLAGQFFALAHSVEHNFHKAETSCKVFANVERSGNGVLCDVQLGISGDFSPYLLDSGQQQTILSYISSANQARAPPRF